MCGVRRSVEIGIIAVALFLESFAHASDDPTEQDPSGREVPTEAPESETLPPGHPPVAGVDGETNPRAQAHGDGMPGIFEPPSDSEKEDPSLPPGTIEVDLRDADNRPVPHELVTLGAMTTSVAKGDSRRHFQQTTDDAGRAVFGGLATTSDVAYRVSCGFQGGAFAAWPFRLDAKSMRVVLHVYPVARDLDHALVASEVTLASEVRDDRLQFEEVVTFYNVGRTAWQPDDVRLSLPDGFKALRAQASMSDQGVEEISGGAQLRGTFPPGRHTVEFQWQLPWSGEREIDFDVGLPPHAVGARVVMPVAGEIRLDVAGFPSPQTKRDGRGQRFLVTERQMRPNEPPSRALAIAIRGLPTPGPGRLIATLLSACGVAIGLVLSFSSQARASSRQSAKAVRSRVLYELEELERARLSGEVGPRTYERMRHELLDALARTLRPV